jgi:hypothetical protein
MGRKNSKVKKKAVRKSASPKLDPGLPGKPAKQKTIERKPMVGRSGRLKMPGTNYEVG